MCMHKLTLVGDSNEAVKVSLGIVFGLLAAVLVIIVVVLLAVFLKRKGKQTTLSVIIV